MPSRCRLMALPARSDQVPLVAVTSRKRFWTGTTRSVSLPPGANECVFWGPSFAVCVQIIGVSAEKWLRNWGATTARRQRVRLLRPSFAVCVQDVGLESGCGIGSGVRARQQKKLEECNVGEADGLLWEGQSLHARSLTRLLWSRE